MALRLIGRFAIPLTLLALVASCSSSPTGPSDGSGTFTATIDGSNFTASSSANAATANGSATVPGFVVIQGTQITSTTNVTTISIELGFIAGTGTYPLGVNQDTTAGGGATVSVSTSGSFKSWNTDLDGAAGTIVITKLTSTEIAGTFNFTAPRALGQSGADTTVANGKFDVPLSSFVAASSTNPGNLFKITSLGGSAFNGATIVFQGSASSFGFTATTTKTVNGSLVTTSVFLGSTGTITAGTSYPISTPAGGGPYISILATIGSATFGAPGGQPGDNGTVTISSNSGGRLKGTFSGNLQSGLSIVGGTFDVKIGS